MLAFSAWSAGEPEGQLPRNSLSRPHGGRRGAAAAMQCCRRVKSTANWRAPCWHPSLTLRGGELESSISSLLQG